MTRSVEIPQASVDALAHVLFDSEWVPGDWRWEQYPEPNRWQELARKGLAALPYLAPAEPSHERVEQVLRERLLKSNFSDNIHEPLRTQIVDQWVDVLAGALFHSGLFAAPAGDGGLREALAAIKAKLDERSEEGEAHLFLNIPYWQLEELLAAHPAAPAVPQPVDREALEEAIREPFSWLGARQMYADEVRRAADAVLAVLAGEQEQAPK